jgi:ABC-2 type transport system ATP-binding protein
VEIRKLIKEVGKNKTIILSTHIMQEVEAICDRVIIINKGNLVADNTLENLKKEGGTLEEIFRKLTN